MMGIFTQAKEAIKFRMGNWKKATFHLVLVERKYYALEGREEAQVYFFPLAEKLIFIR